MWRFFWSTHAIARVKQQAAGPRARPSPEPERQRLQTPQQQRTHLQRATRTIGAAATVLRMAEQPVASIEAANGSGFALRCVFAERERAETPSFQRAAQRSHSQPAPKTAPRPRRRIQRAVSNHSPLALKGL
jgi:hypothetical protein